MLPDVLEKQEQLLSGFARKSVSTQLCSPHIHHNHRNEWQPPLCSCKCECGCVTQRDASEMDDSPYVCVHASVCVTQRDTHKEKQKLKMC